VNNTRCSGLRLVGGPRRGTQNSIAGEEPNRFFHLGDRRACC
jgi:hypothetical protein